MPRLAAHVEFVDLSVDEEARLHRTLLRGTSPAPPQETGALLDVQDSADTEHGESHELLSQAVRAREAGVPPSEWYAVSQGSHAHRELFLAVAEAPRTSGGASSSGMSRR